MYLGCEHRFNPCCKFSEYRNTSELVTGRARREALTIPGERSESTSLPRLPKNQEYYIISGLLDRADFVGRV